ncbi:phosphate-starvation-inducible protein PsiE [Vibrio porteresiae]|uniref:Protein PsiE n=1 Tax=Vibrio porteresiae DSM 19223 TaxID=1123496 RepID=A0ABZ0QH54_9VIBR|nr:phosphate-starvation-inducible PsiE family protein [Vibrio porteresiae]WPC75839.1 phosphate-starvation-inducible PsiE family protein [Vibrio porteresiae DSM 19223]
MNKIRKLGYHYLTIIEDLGLLLIAALTIIAMGVEVGAIYRAMTVSLGDLLLLFIYLEVLAMVGLYLKSGRLPVRMPLYIVIVALARYMALDMKNLDTMNMLGIAGAILIIALSILVIRFGHKKFPYGETDADN